MLSVSFNIQHISYEHWAYIRRDNYYLVGFAVVFGYLKKMFNLFFCPIFPRHVISLSWWRVKKKPEYNEFIYGSASQFSLILLMDSLHSAFTSNLGILSWNGPLPICLSSVLKSAFQFPKCKCCDVHFLWNRNHASFDPTSNHTLKENGISQTISLLSAKEWKNAQK